MSKKKLKSTSGFSIWLLPDHRTHSILKNMIRQLSGIFSTPLFTPHVTLSGTPEDSVQSKLQSVIDDLAVSNAAFSVHAKERMCGTPPYQRFYLHIESTAELYSLAAECNELLNGSYARKDHFHFSLMYGFEDCNSIRNAINKTELKNLNELYIQKIALTDIGGKPEEWEIVYSRNLLT